jgi:hypothetical protein
MDQRLWFYLNGHPKHIREFLTSTDADLTMILSELLILSNLLAILDEELLKILNEILPILNAGVQPTCVHRQVECLLQTVQEKFCKSLV